MTGLRYIMEFDGRIVASAMDLGTALILAESFAEKFHANMESGAKIILYCDEIEQQNESEYCSDWNSRKPISK